MALYTPASLRLQLSIALAASIVPLALTAIVAFAHLQASRGPLSSEVTALLFTMFTAAGVAGPLLVWFFYLYPLSKRIRQATSAAKQLADGNYKLIYQDTHNDELQQLRYHIHRTARGHSEDHEQRERDQQTLSHQASHDELTGLSNRKFGNETIARLEKTGNADPISILFLDLDGFKAINDSCGHAVGDEILVAVSLRLKAILHKDAVLIRWGGDEFVIVLPGASPRNAISVAQDVADLFKQPYSTTQGIHKLGCSIGISTSRPDASLETVLQEADASMYDQKKKHKSREQASSRSSTGEIDQSDGQMNKAA